MRLISFMLADSTTSSTVVTIVMLVLVVVAFYFFLIRPQKKQEKAQQELRDNMKVGDEVTTIGGIVGKIVSLKEETVVIETTKDKTHIRFLRAAIRSIDVVAEDSHPPKKEEAPETNGKKKGKKKKSPIEPATMKDEPASAETPVEEASTEETVADAPAETPVESAADASVEQVEAPLEEAPKTEEETPKE